MIKIQKDGHSIVCSNASYNTMYKRLGYTIVVEQKEVQPTKKVEKKEEKTLEIPVIEIKAEKEVKTKTTKNKK